jgi:hypothetical protein
MSESLRPGTPQFQTALLRKLKNIQPDFDVEFVRRENGTTFRLRDFQGRARSGLITINPRQTNVLELARLQELLTRAGFPGKHD